LPVARANDRLVTGQSIHKCKYLLYKKALIYFKFYDEHGHNFKNKAFVNLYK